MSVKLLLDENLSPAAAVALAADGIDACHAGIVVVERGGLLRDEQIALMREVAATLADHGAMINELLRVAADGSMTFEASPS